MKAGEMLPRFLEVAVYRYRMQERNLFTSCR